jgi:hypothetical protein
MNSIRDQIRYRNRFLPALLLLGLFGGPVLAQSSVEKAETTQQVKELAAEHDRARVAIEKNGQGKVVKSSSPEAGRQWGIYSTRSSMEVGHRFEDTQGSRERFLSDVNVRDGFRLLDYSLDMRAQPGTGILFDFMKVDVNNAGGDVAQNMSIRFDKNRVYQFDGQVRRINYFRTPGQEFALGYRNHDLRQQMSDFRLRVLPQRKVSFNLGYGRNMAKGRFNPTYTYESDIFQLLGEARWQTDDYTAGIEATHQGWNFGVETFYRRFRNDPTINSRPGLDTGFGQPAPRPGAISLLDRETPWRSQALVTRANLRGSVRDRLHIVLRGWRDDEKVDAPYLELSQGVASNNSQILNRTFTGNGTVNRPGTMLDSGVSYDLTENFTITNTFNYTKWRIIGDLNTLQSSSLRTSAGALQNTVATTFASQLTDLESFRNILDFSANFGKKLFAHANWRSQHRNVQLQSLFANRSTATAAVTNTLGADGESIGTNTFGGGVRVRPTKQTNFFFDLERGESNNAFVRINPLEHTRVRARAQVRATDTFSFYAAFTSLDRTNPTPQVLNDSSMRSYTISANYEPSTRAYFDAGYDYQDLASTANLEYFLAGSRRTTGRSLYYSRINSLFVNSRFGVTSRVDLMLYYYYIMDRGAPAVAIGATDLLNAYPLRRHNPEARIAYRFNNRVTGNLSFRHFSYNEDLFSFQDYRSNILTTSLRFTF